MLVHARLMLALLTGMVLLVAQPALAQSQRPEVDLALVLAVDISLSMDDEEQRLQRDGYVAAFRDAAVQRAIASGLTGRIAVTYLEWAGEGIQSVIVPWRVVGGPAEAEAFATELAARPLSRAQMTSISSALLKAAAQFSALAALPSRRVIDVSGDGPNNVGMPVVEARRAVLAQGIVVNGLAIRIPRTTGRYRRFDLPDLDRYYGACVIGGPGSFVLSIDQKSNFSAAIRQKLLLEIAGRQPAAKPRLRRVQFAPGRPTYDCLIGEKRWRDFLEDIWND